VTGTRKLPQNWRWEKLGNLFKVDKKQIDSSNPDFANLPFLGLENIEAHTRKYNRSETNQDTGESSCFLFDDGHVMYGKLRPYLNKVYLPEQHGRCSMELLPLKPSVGYSRNFVALILQSELVINYAIKHSTGGRMPRANINKLVNLRVPIPIKIEEQNEIVGRLENNIYEIERMRQAALRQKEAAEAMQGAILREVLTAKKDHCYPTSISKIADIIMGQSPDGSTYNKDGIGIPLLNGPTEFGPNHPTPVQWTSAAKKLCQVGDLIVCVRASTGKMNWADQVYCLGRGVASIRGKKERGDTLFIRYALEHKIRELLVGSERSTFPNLGKDQLNVFEIYAPKDISTQENIAKGLKEKLSIANKTVGVATTQLEAIEAMPAAMLREVFDFEAETGVVD